MYNKSLWIHFTDWIQKDYPVRTMQTLRTNKNWAQLPFQTRHCTSVLPRLGLLYVTPPMLSAAEYWLWNPTSNKTEPTFCKWSATTHPNPNIYGMEQQSLCSAKTQPLLCGLHWKTDCRACAFYFKDRRNPGRLNRGKRFLQCCSKTQRREGGTAKPPWTGIDELVSLQEP